MIEQETTAPLEVRLEAAEQLLEVAAAVARSASLTAALDALFDSFRHLVPYDRMEYASISEDGSTLLTRWVRADYEPVLLQEGFRYRRGGAGQAESFAEGSPAPYIEIDTLAYASTRPHGHPSHLLVAEGIRSGMCCPLHMDGRRIGYLFFCSRTPRAYDDFHLWAMARIAGVATGAIVTGELRDELAARNRQLEELSAFRTRYLATVSHELRTPLTAVVGLAQEVKDGLDAFDRSELAELVGMLAEQSRDTAAIVEDLLLLAKAETGRLEVEKVPIDLGELARTLTSVFDPEVTVTGEGEAVGDPGRVRQILRNLITNARKHGGPTVWVEVATTGDQATMTVADDGPGIPEAARGAVFEAFVSAQELPGSIGIGLWVSQELAARMGGSLDYSYLDGTSRFTLALPATGSG